MPKLNAQQFADKLVTRLGQSTEEMRRGIENVTESPTAKAAAKADKMKANLIKSIDSGKWAAGLKRISTDDWKRAMIEKGLPRVAAGAEAAKGKIVAFAEQLLPFEAALQTQVKSMPDLTIEDSINRSNAWIRGMAKFTKK